MSMLLTALGLMFVIEGALYALFPIQMKEMMARLQDISIQHLRMMGLILAVFGFLVVAAMHGF